MRTVPRWATVDRFVNDPLGELHREDTLPGRVFILRLALIAVTIVLVITLKPLPQVFVVTVLIDQPSQLCSKLHPGFLINNSRVPLPPRSTPVVLRQTAELEVLNQLDVLAADPLEPPQMIAIIAVAVVISHELIRAVVHRQTLTADLTTDAGDGRRHSARCQTSEVCLFVCRRVLVELALNVVRLHTE